MKSETFVYQKLTFLLLLQHGIDVDNVCKMLSFGATDLKLIPQFSTSTPKNHIYYLFDVFFECGSIQGE